MSTEIFSLQLFKILYKVVVTFESVNKILARDHSNESSSAVFAVVLFIVLDKVVPTFESVNETIHRTIEMKATEQYFPACCLSCCTRWF